MATTKPRLNQIKQEGATSEQVPAWNGTTWAPANVADLINITSSEVVFGTGTGITSSANFTFSGSTITLTSTASTPPRFLSADYSFGTNNTDAVGIEITRTIGTGELTQRFQNSSGSNSTIDVIAGSNDARILLSSPSTSDFAVGVDTSDSGLFKIASTASIRANSFSSTISNYALAISNVNHLYLSNGISFTGVSSPSSITSNQNNYTPTAGSFHTTFRLTSNNDYNITGWANGIAGKLLYVYNIGSFTLTLVDESASSTAANRFALGSNIAIAPNKGVTLLYDGVSSRWRCVARNATDVTLDGNGIYTGSGTIASGAEASLLDDDVFRIKYFNTNDAISINDATETIILGSADATSSISILPGSVQISGSAAGQIGFNAGTFSAELGSTGFIVSGGTAAGQLALLEPSGSGTSYTGFIAPALAANLMYTLPTTATDGYFLKYNSTGDQLEWAANLGGIYGGSGTVTDGTDATVDAGGTFNFRYGTSTNIAISVSDDNGEVGILSPTGATYSYISDDGIAAGTDQFVSFAVTGGNALTISSTETQFAGPVAIAPIGGAISIDANAILQLDGVTGGLLLNRLTTTERNALSTVPDGLLLYNTTTDALTLRANGAWVELGAGGGDGNGIYDGSGTIASGAVATITATSSFKINYSTASIGFQIDDVDNSVTLYSDSGSNYVYVNDTSVDVENVGSLHLIAAPTSDHSFSGTTITLTANENQAFGDVCYIASDGDAALADADAIATAKVVAMCTETVTTGNPAKYLLMGIARDDTWAWTVGGHVYLSTTGTTGNTLTQTAPSGTDDCVVVIGVATHADRILFNPSQVILEIQ